MAKPRENFPYEKRMDVRSESLGAARKVGFQRLS